MLVRVRCFAAAREWFAGEFVDVAGESDMPLTAGMLKRLLAERRPDRSELIHSCFVAKNQSYAPDEEPLSAGDEIALIPPVSGGMPGDGETGSRPACRYLITPSPIDPADVVGKVQHPDHGASILFIGTTREHTNGKKTIRLEYEAYEPMALRLMGEIGEEIASRWPGTLCAMTHRIGVVGIGEASVAIAVSSPHRAACYEASRYAIDKLKQRVPIWKKEIWEDGTEWQGQPPGPWNPLGET